MSKNKIALGNRVTELDELLSEVTDMSELQLLEAECDKLYEDKDTILKEVVEGDDDVIITDAVNTFFELVCYQVIERKRKQLEKEGRK